MLPTPGRGAEDMGPAALLAPSVPWSVRRQALHTRSSFTLLICKEGESSEREGVPYYMALLIFISPPHTHKDPPLGIFLPAI